MKEYIIMLILLSGGYILGSTIAKYIKGPKIIVITRIVKMDEWPDSIPTVNIYCDPPCEFPKDSIYFK